MAKSIPFKPSALLRSGFKWLLLVLFFVEIAIFILVAQAVGFFMTLLGVILGGVAGVHLLKAHAATLRQQMQGGFSAAANPVTMLNGGVVVAGLLFLIPGFFTDMIALVILIPSVRRYFSRRATPPPRKPSSPQTDDAPPGPQSGNIIEGEYWREDR